MSGLEQVKAAILATQVPSRAQEATRWLVNFERTPESWVLTERLLHEEGVGDGSLYRQFGGKLLHSKIQRDLELLAPDQVGSLTASLLSRLTSLATQQPLERAVCRYVCLSIAALAVQINQPGVVKQILQLVDPIIAPAPQVVLDLLTFLPEEADNRTIDITLDQRDAFVLQLTDSMDMILAFLLALWSSSSASTQNDILKCLSRWISLTNIQWDRLVAQPIFSLAMGCLTSAGPLFVEASYVLIEVIARFDASKVPGVIAFVIPQVLSLRGVWTSLLAALLQDEDDEDILDMCRAIANVYARVGRSYMRIIFSTADIGQTEIVAQLLECARFRYSRSIAAIPLKFFFDLSQEISLARSSTDQVVQFAPVIASLTPMYGDLLQVAMQQVRLRDKRFESKLESESDTNKVDVKNNNSTGDGAAATFVPKKAGKAYHRAQLTEDECDDRSEYRDIMVDCATVLGGESAMKIVCTSLQSILSAIPPNGSPLWADVECRLLGAQMVACYVPEDEATVLPWLLQFLSCVPDVGPMMGTVMELVGRLSRWLACNPQYLMNFMNQLGSALRTDYSCVPAARALKSILADCYKVPGLPIEQMHELLLETRTRGSLSLEADLDVIAGFRKVIINMPPGSEGQGRALQSLIEPIVAELASATSAGPEHASAAVLIPSLDRLAAALQHDANNRNYDPQTLLPFFVQSVQILQAGLAANQSESVAEKTCRVYKHCMRNCKEAFTPYLAPMCSHLVEAFERKQYAAFIYAGSICVADFGKQPENVATIYDLVWGLSRTFFQAHGSLDKFIASPDVVEEYYYFMVKVLKTCPTPMLAQSTDTATLIGAGIMGLELEHRDAQKGIVSFFDEVLKIALGRGAGQAQEICDAAKALIFHYGANFVAALVNCLSGQLSLYVLCSDRRDGGPSVVELMFKMRELGVHQLQEWFVAALSSLPERIQGNAIKSGIPNALATAGNAMDFYDVLMAFEGRNRNKS